MSVFQCRMCGGPLPVTAEPIVECEYCGSRQPVPSADSEKKQTLFARANRLRLECEFDRAAAVYESIAAEFPEEAEASWGIVLCRYGIEYVDDPATGQKVPTCHRSSYASVLDDKDYQQTMDCANPLARKLYHREAARIEELRENILVASSREEPYDIFICYKETAEDGDRTLDSVLAQDIYDLLTGRGYRVFFSRVSLEDKLGREYEPYIFAALNSAKVMLAVGTCFEHYDAVWVKNEWSRFLKLMEKDQEKYLIPCFKDIDAYDMPKEFRKLQAQDLGKVGAHQDLLRGIEKILPRQTEHTKGTVAPLLKRAYMYLEDGEWEKADDFFEQALNQDPELAEAYLGKFLAQNHAISLENLSLACIARTEKAYGVKKEACPRDLDAEKRAEEQYTIPGYLDSATIMDAFLFDRTYESVTPYRQKQLNEIRLLWTRDKTLSRAEQFGNAKLKEQIEQHRTAVLSVFETRFAEAQELDVSNTTYVTRKYAQAIKDATDYIHTLYQRKFDEKREEEEEKKRKGEEEKRKEEEKKRKEEEKKRKEEEEKRNEYDRAIKFFRNAYSCDDYIIAQKKFERLGNYENARSMVDTCQTELQLRLERRKSRRCQYCGGMFSGFLTKTCAICGEKKDY